MRNLKVILLSIIVHNAVANDSITTMSDYAQHSMTELVSNPTLKLLKNIKGKSRHELSFGYITAHTDDNATLSTGAITKESGESSGFGIGYGYTKSFKNKWAYYFWLQGVQQEGDHTQTTNGITTGKITDFSGVYLNISFGLSYEFLRETKKHTLNVFAGPSLMLIDISGAVQAYNDSGAIEAAYDGSFDGTLPALMAGIMYEYKFLKNFEVIPYSILVYSLASECQEYRVDNVALNQGNSIESSPKCDPKLNSVDKETDIAPSFLSVGFKINYSPWDIGFNISGIIRDIILRGDSEDRAQVKGGYLSVSKSWE